LLQAGHGVDDDVLGIRGIDGNHRFTGATIGIAKQKIFFSLPSGCWCATPTAGARCAASTGGRCATSTVSLRTRLGLLRGNAARARNDHENQSCCD
jgi:hypothetical protein